MKRLETILAITICPRCGSNLGLTQNGGIRCDGCDQVYPVVNNQVDLRLDTTLVSLPKESRLRNLIKPPSPTFNRGAQQRIAQFLSYSQAEGAVLNFGSGTQPRFADNVYNVDIFPYTNIDIVCPIDIVPFKPESIAAIISIAVLEHVKNPQQIVRKFHEVLEAPGRVYIEVPFMQGIHGDPYDFQRLTPDGLRILLNNFKEVQVDSFGGPSSALCWLIREFAASFGGNSRVLYTVLKLLSGWATFPLKYLDVLLKPTIGGRKIASGFYFIGEKK